MSKFIAYRISDGYILQWQDNEEFNYPEQTVGVDTVEITDSQYAARKDEAWYVKGKITNKAPDPAPLPEKSAEDIALSKRISHSNPISGSDHLFINALRLKFNGNEGWERAVELANTRYDEIEQEFLGL